jgi:MOB kinase activator 1
MTWIQSQLDDEEVFPTRSGKEFPPDFDGVVRTIFRHLFRILAHIYQAHYEQVLHLEQERHLNTLFAHFICFVREFDLDRREIGCLKELIEQLLNES